MAFQSCYHKYLLYSSLYYLTATATPGVGDDIVDGLNKAWNVAKDAGKAVVNAGKDAIAAVNTWFKFPPWAFS